MSGDFDEVAECWLSLFACDSLLPGDSIRQATASNKTDNRLGLCITGSPWTDAMAKMGDAMRRRLGTVIYDHETQVFHHCQ
jgi:hypothetical protein